MSNGTCPSSSIGPASGNNAPANTSAALMRSSRQHVLNVTAYVVPPPSESPPAPMRSVSMRSCKRLCGILARRRTWSSTNDTSAGCPKARSKFCGRPWDPVVRRGKSRRGHDVSRPGPCREQARELVGMTDQPVREDDQRSRLRGLRARRCWSPGSVRARPGDSASGFGGPRRVDEGLVPLAKGNGRCTVAWRFVGRAGRLGLVRRACAGHRKIRPR